jgi:hypothetical protein
MRIRVDARLTTEAARVGFRFACEDCVHFAPDGDRCSLGHPPEPRRSALDPWSHDAGDGPGPERYLETCKDFDLV